MPGYETLCRKGDNRREGVSGTGAFGYFGNDYGLFVESAGEADGITGRDVGAGES